MLRPGEQTLTAIPDRPDSSHVEIEEHFDLGAGANQNSVVTYNIRSRYEGYRAEYIRYKFDNTSRDEIQKNYLEFYRTYFDKVDLSTKLESSTAPDNSAFITLEAYQLPEFWEENDDDYRSWFYANSILSYIPMPDERERNSPLVLDLPTSVKHKINIQFGDDNWSFENEEFIEENPYFTLTRVVQFFKPNKRLEIDYEFKLNSDHVPADKIDAYLESRTRAKDELEYSILEYKIQTGLDDASEAEDSETDTVFWSVIGLFFAGIFYVLISWFKDSRAEITFENAHYYPVSILKIFLLCILTFTFYGMYWGYRNWHYVKQTQKNNIMPVARGFFHNLWYYPLFQNLVNDSKQRFDENRVLPVVVGVIFAILYLISIAIDDGALFFISIIMVPALLSPMANYINHLDNNEEAYLYNSRWKLRHWILGLFTLPIMGIILASEAHIIPGDEVVKGKSILAHDIAFLKRKGVIPATEEIDYFYSDAMFNVRADGNGFTSSTVFSYWKDDQDVFQFQTANLADVASIEPSFDENWNENSVITITMDDNSDFILFVSNGSDKDHIFYDALLKRWKEANLEE